jgi:hypothetical protein
VPTVFRHAAEIIIWPGLEDQSSATALAFVPDVIDLRNIDELVIGGASPPQITLSSNRFRGLRTTQLAEPSGELWKCRCSKRLAVSRFPAVPI